MADSDINPCRSCDRCWNKETERIIKDDIRWILGELRRCDAIILRSPFHFRSTGAQLKSLLDRSVALHSENNGPLRNKVAVAVVTQHVNGREGRWLLRNSGAFVTDAG